MRFSLLYDIQKVDILLTHILSQCPTSIHPENIRKPEILVVNMLKRINMVFLKMIITFMNKHSQKKQTNIHSQKKKACSKNPKNDNGSIFLVNYLLNVSSKI